MTKIGESKVVPRPQEDIHSGAVPPGRGSITKLIPDKARYPLSATMMGCTRTYTMISAISNW